MTRYSAPSPVSPQAIQPVRPASITTAVRLMCAGGVLSLLGVAVTLLAVESVREASAREFAQNVSAAFVFQIAIVAVVVVNLAGSGLWFGLALANRHGVRRARTLATALCVLDTLWLLGTFAGQSRTALLLGLSPLIWLAGLGAVFYLWKQESSAYYDAASARQ